MTQSSDSQVVKREQCPSCLDSGKDNVAVYSDGSKFCYSCDSSVSKPWKLSGTVQGLSSRKLSEETCRWAQAEVGNYSGFLGKERVQNKPVKIFNYYNNSGKLIRQKIKDVDKNMTQRGPKGDSSLYLQWKWPAKENMFITITEGEEDALSVAQACGYQYPVVSVPNGAAGARRALQRNLQYLLGFKYVILAFDNDDDGRKAMEECADLFEPGRVRLATWPQKDANDLLKAGKDSEIKSVLFNAKPIDPEHIVTVSDILDDVLVKPEYGADYPWKSLNDITYGFQSKEIHVIVGANGIGKTEYVKELMYHFIQKDMKIGLFSFEQTPDNTVRRLIGSKLGVKLHLPGEPWDPEAVKKAAMDLDNKVYLYDKAGSANSESIFRAIRFLARAKDCKLFFIDNLKGLCAGKSFDDVKNMMTRIQTLKNDLDISIVLLSHVSKDKFNYQAYVSTSPKNLDLTTSQTAEDIEALIKKPGMEWESGRMPSKENVEGSSAVTDLADYVFALARNTTSQDEQEKCTLRVKCLKARLDGGKTGQTFKLHYTAEGTYSESSMPSLAHKDIQAF